MKKTKLLKVLMLAFVSSFIFFSCSDEEEAPPNPLLGTWNLDKITWADVAPDSLTYWEGAFEPTLLGISKQELIFNEDNTVEYEERVQGVINSFDAEWVFDEVDNEITIEFEDGNEAVLELDADEMELIWVVRDGPASLTLPDRTVQFTNLRVIETYVKQVQ